MEFIENQFGEVRHLMGATATATTATPTTTGTGTGTGTGSNSGSGTSSNAPHQQQQQKHQQHQQQQHQQHPSPLPGLPGHHPSHHHFSPGSAVSGNISAHDAHRHEHHGNNTTTTNNNNSLGLSTISSASSPIVATNNLNANTSTTTSTISTNTSTNTLKRKGSIEASSPNASKTPQQRSKRNRYISIACNECKRRKIKCNGETPCHRCGNLNLQCLYAPNCCSNSLKDSEEFKEMANKVNRLQEQVETLFSNINSLRADSLRLAPIQERIPTLTSAASTPSSSSALSMPAPQHKSALPHPRQTSFRGPTSTHFSLDVAKNTLHKMGYSNLGEAVDDDCIAHDTPAESPMLGAQQGTSQYASSRDILWDFDKDEIIRLCHLHEEEIGIMYPVVRIETVIAHARSLAEWMDTMKKNGLAPQHGQDIGALNDLSTLVLKIVMAIGLVVEANGCSEKAHRIFESVRPTAEKMLMSDPSDVKVIPFLALVAGYRFLSSDEILAWRTMGQVARLCIELGLHRRDAIMRIENEEARNNAIHTFWSAYTLDRRWAFSTGLPWVVPDDDIDSTLPYPDSRPFLTAMITYSKLSAKVWKLVRHLDPNEAVVFHPSDFDELNSQIKQWYTSIPKEIQLNLPDWESIPRYLNPPVNSQEEYDIQRLQIWTYLRLNQIRIWLFTPFLHTHSSIMENLHFAERVVKLAKNTIRYLTHLNNTTNIYRKIQAFYHQFLTSAIAVLFLASCHAPVNFSSSCRDEFYMALDLVKDMSSRSFVSKRLWTTIKSLREVAPRLGLAEDPHSNAALTMAGLATGQMGPTGGSSTGGLTPATNASHSPIAQSSFARPQAPPSQTSVHGQSQAQIQAQAHAQAMNLDNGHQISSEMSRIFEDYISMCGYSPPPDPSSAPSSAAAAATTASIQHTPHAMEDICGSVYHHFREMF